MKQHYPASLCYKLALLGPNNSMWSVNISRNKTLEVKEGRLYVQNGIDNLLEYKMGHITVPVKTVSILYKKLPKVFCFSNIEDAHANASIYQIGHLPLVLVAGYGGNPITIEDETDEEKITRKYKVFLSTSAKSPYLLCDWFLPVEIMKVY